MIYEFTIPGRLGSLNDYISRCRANHYKGAAYKAKQQEIVERAIIKQLGRIHITKPVTLNYEWYEYNTRRDLDNVAGWGHKVIQDALTACNVLSNDGWKNIKGFTDVFAIDRENPRIVVYLEEVE